MKSRISRNSDVMTISIVITSITFGIAIFSEYSGLDFAIAKLFYDPERHIWPLHDSWMTDDLLHVWGLRVLVSAYAVALVLLGLSFRVARLRWWRRVGLMFVFGGLTGPTIVAITKRHTHVYTPKKLIEFGGTMPHVRLFDEVPVGMPCGNAFPAGHAAGGYGLFCLFFLFRAYRPKYQWLGLFSGLCVGMVFGLAQQARGQHFLSHDLTSAIICWWSAWLAYHLIIKDPAVRRQQPFMK